MIPGVLTPLARHRLLIRLEIDDCACPPVWFDVPFPDGTSIRWLRPCPHILDAQDGDSPQNHDLSLRDWAALLVDDDAAAFRIRPPPAQAEETHGDASRQAVMMGRRAAGEDLFHADDKTDLPRIALFPKRAGGHRVADAEVGRPARHTVTVLRSPRLAALVPLALIAAVQALADDSHTTRLIVLSPAGRLYAVLADPCTTTTQQYALAVLAIAPREGGHPWTPR